MGLLDDAAEIANASDRNANLEAISKILEEYPGGDFIFVLIDQNDEHSVVLSDYSEADYQMRAFIAQSYLHLLYSAYWGHPEEADSEE